MITHSIEFVPFEGTVLLSDDKNIFCLVSLEIVNIMPAVIYSNSRFYYLSRRRFVDKLGVNFVEFVSFTNTNLDDILRVGIYSVSVI